MTQSAFRSSRRPVLDRANDRRENGAGNATASDLAHDTTDIRRGGAVGQQRDQHTEDLSPDATTHCARDCVSKRAQIDGLGRIGGDISTDSAADDLNQQIDEHSRHDAILRNPGVKLQRRAQRRTIAAPSGSLCAPMDKITLRVRRQDGKGLGCTACFHATGGISMKAIAHQDHPPEVWRPGVETRMLVSAMNGAAQLCIFEQWVAPGAGAPTHHHRVEEVLTVCEGEAEMWIETERLTVPAGRSLIIPAGRCHGFRNSGTSTLHIRAVLASPVFEAIPEGAKEVTRRWQAA
jgi:mannose-6-phosphate isomerase-like protein (cupin superfamily)